MRALVRGLAEGTSRTPRRGVVERATFEVVGVPRKFREETGLEERVRDGFETVTVCARALVTIALEPCRSRRCARGTPVGSDTITTS